jgi:hypothetical protein
MRITYSNETQPFPEAAMLLTSVTLKVSIPRIVIRTLLLLADAAINLNSVTVLDFASRVSPPPEATMLFRSIVEKCDNGILGSYFVMMSDHLSDSSFLEKTLISSVCFQFPFPYRTSRLPDSAHVGHPFSRATNQKPNPVPCTKLYRANDECSAGHHVAA